MTPEYKWHPRPNDEKNCDLQSGKYGTVNLSVGFFFGLYCIFNCLATSPGCSLASLSQTQSRMDFLKKSRAFQITPKISVSHFPSSNSALIWSILELFKGWAAIFPQDFHSPDPIFWAAAHIEEFSFTFFQWSSIMKSDLGGSAHTLTGRPNKHTILLIFFSGVCT